MNTKTKNILILLSFILSNLFIFHYVRSKNTDLMKRENARPQMYSVEEVNPSVLNEIVNELNASSTVLASKIKPLLTDLTRTKTVSLHRKEDPNFLISYDLFFLALSLVAFVSLLVTNDKLLHKKKHSALFMDSLANVEYPVLLVNSSLEIVWQNQKSSLINLSDNHKEKIFDETLDGTEITIDSKKYSVLVNEMNFEHSKHYLAHLLPRNRWGQKELSKQEGAENLNDSVT